MAVFLTSWILYVYQNLAFIVVLKKKYPKIRDLFGFFFGSWSGEDPGQPARVRLGSACWGQAAWTEADNPVQLPQRRRGRGWRWLGQVRGSLACLLWRTRSCWPLSGVCTPPLIPVVRGSGRLLAG